MDSDEIRIEDLYGLEQDEMLERLITVLNPFMGSTKSELGNLPLKNAKLITQVVTAGDWGWITPAFQNSWTHAGTGEPTAGYRIDDKGMVYLRGKIKSGTLNATGFTLPVGYRPSGLLTFSTISRDVLGRLDVQADGQCIIGKNLIGSNTWFSLQVPPFQADAPAVPTGYVGDHWPMKVRHGLPGQVIGVSCVKAEKVNGSPDDMVLSPSVCWENASDGLLKIKSVSGLAKDTKYRLTFLVIGD